MTRTTVFCDCCHTEVTSAERFRVEPIPQSTVAVPTSREFDFCGLVCLAKWATEKGLDKRPAGK